MRELNKDAYIYLLLSITGDAEAGRVVFQIVCISKTENLGDRGMHISCKRLTGKFEAKEDPSWLLSKKKFNNDRITNPKANIEIWVTTLEYLALKYNNSGGNMIDENLV